MFKLFSNVIMCGSMVVGFHTSSYAGQAPSKSQASQEDKKQVQDEKSAKANSSQTKDKKLAEVKNTSQTEEEGSDDVNTSEPTSSVNTSALSAESGEVNIGSDPGLDKLINRISKSGDLLTANELLSQAFESFGQEVAKKKAQESQPLEEAVNAYIKGEIPLTYKNNETYQKIMENYNKASKIQTQPNIDLESVKKAIGTECKENPILCQHFNLPAPPKTTEPLLLDEKK